MQPVRAKAANHAAIGDHPQSGQSFRTSFRNNVLRWRLVQNSSIVAFLETPETQNQLELIAARQWLGCVEV
jgi:hypothetical protein